jgi:potassium-transporting ATPase KdpC subunit
LSAEQGANRSDTRRYREDWQRRHALKASAMPTPTICGQALSLVTGLAYPVVVTGMAQAVFPAAANGSLIVVDGRTVGSALIGQSFSDPKCFWGRPSATAPMSHNASASGGSNWGSGNPALLEAAKAHAHALREADPGNTLAVPVDLLTASASGLDPHISPAAAKYQIGRIARLRGLDGSAGLRVKPLEALIAAHTEPQWLGFLGEARVNVLQLNLALGGCQSPDAPS